MNHYNFTRRGFLSGIAAVGGATLLPQSANALARKDGDENRGAPYMWKSRTFKTPEILKPGYIVCARAYESADEKIDIRQAECGFS